MSTLTTSNLSDGATTVGTQYVVNGSAKAWVNFNGTGTIATRDSFNISSVSDDGTGTYSPSVSNAMAGNNFSVSSSLQIATVIAGVRVPTILTTGWTLICTTTSATADADPVTSAIHGDLA